MSLSLPYERLQREHASAGHTFGSHVMTEGTERTRVAFATFDNGKALFLALTDLDISGLPRNRSGIAGRASAMHSLRKVVDELSGRDCALAPLVVDVEPGDVALGDECMLISRGTFWHHLACFGRAPADSLIVAPWMAPEIRAELIERIHHGTVLLGVSPLTPDQQTQCVRILLTHSSHRVQTHEFRH